jgi:hypothetical protein
MAEFDYHKEYSISTFTRLAVLEKSVPDWSNFALYSKIELYTHRVQTFHPKHLLYNMHIDL